MIRSAPSTMRRAGSGGLERSSGGPKYAGGQFIATEDYVEQRTRARDALPGLIDSFRDRTQFHRAIYEQNAQIARKKVDMKGIAVVPLSTIEAQWKTAIRDTYRQAFLLGKKAGGNLLTIKPNEDKFLRDLRIDEFSYLRNFLGDMRDGKGVMDYTMRADYYAYALREVYWAGWVHANLSPLRQIRWVVGQTEHCEDCLRFNDSNRWYSADDFWHEVGARGYFPQSGKLACKGRYCQCSLEDRIIKEGRKVV
jgi:hypothetical protein